MNKAQLNHAVFLSATCLLLSSTQATAHNSTTEKASLSVAVNNHSNHPSGICRNTWFDCLVTVIVGAPPPNPSVLITNSSAAPAQNLQVTLPAGFDDVNVNNGCPQSLASNASCSISFSSTGSTHTTPGTASVQGSNTNAVTFSIRVLASPP